MQGQKVDGGTTDGQTLQGPTGTWDQDEGGKEGTNVLRIRQKTQECGARRRDERWRLAGVGEVQVDNLLRRERRWGAVVTEREVKRQLMDADGGAVGWRREIKQSRKVAETGGAGGTKTVVMLETESKNVVIPDRG